MAIPRWQELVEELRVGLAAGRWGDALPGERPLAQELGAAPMTVARALRHLHDTGEVHRQARRSTVSTGKSGSGITALGLVLPTYIAGGAANPHYGEIIEILRRCADRAGCRRLVVVSDLAALQRRGGGWQVDAVVAIAPDEELLASWRDQQPPCPVLIDASDSGFMWSRVQPANQAGGYLAAQHLITLGHRRIACIAGHPRFASASERLAGVRAALRRAGLRLHGGRGVSGDFEIEAGRTAAHQLLDLSPAPTAIICGNDAMALGARRACAERNLIVPAQVSLVGFDDQPAAAHLDPPLTTVRVDRLVMAEAAWDLVLSRQRGAGPAVRRVRCVLVVRASSATAEPGPST